MGFVHRVNGKKMDVQRVTAEKSLLKQSGKMVSSYKQSRGYYELQRNIHRAKPLGASKKAKTA